MDTATLTAPEINEGIIAGYLRAKAAGLQKEFNGLRALRVTIGNAGASSFVTVSGFLGDSPNYKCFNGPTVNAAADEARKFFNL